MTDYLLRHPLPDAEETHLERHVKAMIATDHAVVLDKIREETRKDTNYKHSSKQSERATGKAQALT